MFLFLQHDRIFSVSFPYIFPISVSFPSLYLHIGTFQKSFQSPIVTQAVQYYYSNRQLIYNDLRSLSRLIILLQIWNYNYERRLTRCFLNADYLLLVQETNDVIKPAAVPFLPFSPLTGPLPPGQLYPCQMQSSTGHLCTLFLLTYRAKYKLEYFPNFFQPLPPPDLIFLAVILFPPTPVIAKLPLSSLTVYT